eukprot:IDg22296t1
MPLYSGRETAPGRKPDGRTARRGCSPSLGGISRPTILHKVRGAVRPSYLHASAGLRAVLGSIKHIDNFTGRQLVAPCRAESAMVKVRLSVTFVFFSR